VYRLEQRAGDVVGERGQWNNIQNEDTNTGQATKATAGVAYLGRQELTIALLLGQEQQLLNDVPGGRISRYRAS
jgi:hypothetical protein